MRSVKNPLRVADTFSARPNPSGPTPCQPFPSPFIPHLTSPAASLRWIWANRPIRVASSVGSPIVSAVLLVVDFPLNWSTHPGPGLCPGRWMFHWQDASIVKFLTGPPPLPVRGGGRCYACSQPWQDFGCAGHCTHRCKSSRAATCPAGPAQLPLHRLRRALWSLPCSPFSSGEPHSHLDRL